MKKINFLVSLILLIATACSSSSPLGVEVGDSCSTPISEVYFEGLYRSERQTCDNFYCWGFIRFYEDCTYEAKTSFSENVNTVADEFLSENVTLSTGIYSIEGTTILMKTENGEQRGTIHGDKITSEWYSFKTKKGGQHEYNYVHADKIYKDLFSVQGEQQLAPVP